MLLGLQYIFFLSSSMADFWSNVPTFDKLGNEAAVEVQLVLPLLGALGYEGDDIAPKYPVVFQEGRAGRKPEADFVCFWQGIQTRDNSLVVVEAKNPSEGLVDAKAQGESYAQNLRAPILLITNGKILEVWQLQITMESQCVLTVPIQSLTSKRGEIERILNKTAVREYCRSLTFKTIMECTTDFGQYEKAEVKRLSRSDPVITRTLRRSESAGYAISLNSTRLITDFSTGAIVIGPSGYGKTTLSRATFMLAMEERLSGSGKPLPFDVPLPDLEQSSVSLVKFIEERLSAHQPGVTAASLSAQLRDTGAVVCCDSFDRTTVQFQKRVTAEISNLQRDYPLIQVYIFSRAALKPHLPLPVLELDSLSDEQVREFERVVLSDGSGQNFSIVSMMSSILRSLCANPLLLRLTLNYWKRKQTFPNKISFLFQSWLDTVLETDPDDVVSKAQRERALIALAQATVVAPITIADAIAELSRQILPSGLLNELIQCNAVRVSGVVVEVQHDGLADYLRAVALARKSESELLGQIPTLPIPADSFFPVLLMAQLSSRRLQAELWKRLTSTNISLYFDALRYRFDVSDDLRHLNSEQLSRDYLQELIEGVEDPLTSYFPEMRASVLGLLTGVVDAPLAVTGQATAMPAGISYKLHAAEPGQSRVTVAIPEFPGTIRGVNLDLSRFRIDSARLLGMTLLRDTMFDTLKQLELLGGPTWIAERLLGRVRYLAQKHRFDVEINDDLDHLESKLRPLANYWIDEGSFFGKPRFSVQSLLDDIALLRAVGVTALDPWWSSVGWDDNAFTTDDEIYRRVLDEEYRRVQTAYAEVVRASLPHVSSDLIYFPILPIRWKLTVQKRDRRVSPSVIHSHWFPVQSWEDAGADVSFSDGGPGGFPNWEEARDALAKLGRRSTHIPRFGGWRIQDRFDGFGFTPPVTTRVTSEVCSWLEDDLKHLFEGLPPGDGAF